MTAFNPGDPVHVSFDGVVSTRWADGSCTVIRDGKGYPVAPERLSPVPTPVLFAGIHKGDRIRAVNGDTVFEFTVTNLGSGALSCATGHWVEAAMGWQFFRLTPPVAPEPEYEVGAVYQSPLGGIFRRFPDCWQDFDGTKHPHHHPVRPLVRLVPEEQR